MRCFQSLFDTYLKSLMKRDFTYSVVELKWHQGNGLEILNKMGCNKFKKNKPNFLKCKKYQNAPSIWSQSGPELGLGEVKTHHVALKNLLSMLQDNLFKNDFTLFNISFEN